MRALTTAAPLSAGPPIPPFGPTLMGGLLGQHSVTPEKQALERRSHPCDPRVDRQSRIPTRFPPGTILGASLNSQSQSTNASNTRLNPNDLVFNQQAIATVARVVNLYSDLVSLIEDVRIKKETLALAGRVYEDNRGQVQQVTVAPVELTRAEAGVVSAGQDLANSAGADS